MGSLIRSWVTFEGFEEHKQGPHYCEGHAHSWQLCVWPAAQTQMNAIPCLCPPHCYVWEQIMAL
jgi:hypothetical protein